MKKILLLGVLSMFSGSIFCSNGGGNDHDHKRSRRTDSVAVAQPGQPSEIHSLQSSIREMERLCRNPKKHGQFKRKLKDWLEANFMLIDGSFMLLRPDPRPGPQRANTVKDIESVILLLDKLNQGASTLRALGYRQTLKEWRNRLDGLRTFDDISNVGALGNVMGFLSTHDRQALSVVNKRADRVYKIIEKFKVAVQLVGIGQLSLEEYDDDDDDDDDVPVITDIAILEGVNIVVGTNTGQMFFADIDNDWTASSDSGPVAVQSLAKFSPRKILIGMADHLVSLCNLDTRMYEFDQRLLDGVGGVEFLGAFSDDFFVACEEQGRINILSSLPQFQGTQGVVSQQSYWHGAHRRDSVFDVAVRKDELFATAHQSGKIRLFSYNVALNRFEFSDFDASAGRPITALEFISDNRLISSDAEGTVKVWKIEGGHASRCLLIIPTLHGPAYHISDFGDNEVVLSFKNGLVTVLNLATRKQRTIFDAHDYYPVDEDDVYKNLVLDDKRVVLFNKSDNGSTVSVAFTEKYLRRKFIDDHGRWRDVPREDYQINGVDLYHALCTPGSSDAPALVVPLTADALPGLRGSAGAQSRAVLDRFGDDTDDEDDEYDSDGAASIGDVPTLTGADPIVDAAQSGVGGVEALESSDDDSDDNDAPVFRGGQ